MQRRLMIAVMLSSGINAACLAASPPDGQKTFSQRCAKCHTVQKLIPLVKEEPVAGRAAFLRKFLERHYPPPAADRAAVIDYLMKETAR